MRMGTSLAIVFMLTVMVISSACITGGSNKTSSTSSPSTWGETTASQSPRHSGTSSTSSTATYSSSYTSSTPTYSTHETIPSPAEPFLDSLEAISDYTLTMRTYLNVSAVVESSGVVRMENVSLVSNTSAAFDIPSREMEMNISAYTSPAGGRSFTGIFLVGDTAYVRSFGNWSVLHRGDEGFSPIFNTFEHNPVSIVLDAIQGGSCTFEGTPENGSVVCTGEGVLSQAVLLAVGAPDGSKVEVHSGELELDFLNGKPVGGYLEVSFRISSTGSVRLTQEGLLRQEFTIGRINGGENIEPPVTG